MRTFRTRLAALLLACASTSSAGPVGIDGLNGAEWTGVTPVNISIGSPYATHGFQTPAPNTHDVNYDIYMRGDDEYYYALLSASSTPPVFFANLYWDTNPSMGSSDFGLQVTNNRAFRPSGSPYYGMTGYLTFATSVSGIELAIPWSFFREDPLGMGFPKLPEERLMLSLSQSFSYDVVGGQTFGPNRLGVVYAPVPEPAAVAFTGAGLAALAFLSSILRARTSREDAPR